MDIEEGEVPDGLKVVIFRVLQEALSNVARHSQADHVYLSLLKKNASVEFAIQDNGIGFQLDEVDSADHRRTPTSTCHYCHASMPFLSCRHDRNAMVAALGGYLRHCKTVA